MPPIRPRAAWRLTAALGAAAAVCAAGCSGGGKRTTGIRIGDETLRQFKAGETTEQWLVAVLGPPTSMAYVENIPNTKVFRYSLDDTGRGGLVSLFTGSSSRNTAVVYFILTEGVVTRFWADRETERTITGARVQEQGGEKSGPSLLR